MKTQKWENISTKIVAEVRQGSLISLDETKVAEQVLGQNLEWQEVENSREIFGNYFQCLYSAILPNKQAKIAKAAIIQYRKNFDV
jgi:hypothetical protein